MFFRALLGAIIDKHCHFGISSLLINWDDNGTFNKLVPHLMGLLQAP